MKIEKRNEKVMIWMSRMQYTGQFISDKLGITRQAWSQKMKGNNINDSDMIVLKALGFKEY